MFDDNAVYQQQHLTQALQAVLQVLFKHGKERPITFSIFHLDPALLIKKLQSTYPVYFLKMEELGCTYMRGGICWRKLCIEGGLKRITLEETDVLRSVDLSFLAYGKLKEVRTFSSQAGAKSGGEEFDNLDDGFSKLETTHGTDQEAAFGDENENDLISGLESDEKGVADDVHDELGEKESPKSIAVSALAKVILPVTVLSLRKVLEDWVAEGNKVTHSEVSSTMHWLRKRRVFYKALKVIFPVHLPEIGVIYRYDPYFILSLIHRFAFSLL